MKITIFYTLEFTPGKSEWLSLKWQNATEFRRILSSALLEATNGNTTKAAALIGMDRANFRRMIRESNKNNQRESRDDTSEGMGTSG